MGFEILTKELGKVATKGLKKYITPQCKTLNSEFIKGLELKSLTEDVVNFSESALKKVSEKLKLTQFYKEKLTFGTPMFSDTEVDKITDFLVENPEFKNAFEKMFEKRKFYNKGTNSYLPWCFNSDFLDTINTVNKNQHLKKYFSKYINKFTSDNQIELNILPQDIVELLNSPQKKTVIRLLDMNCQDFNKETWGLLSPLKIQEILKLQEIDKTLINKLISNKEYNKFLKIINEDNMKLFKDSKFLDFLSSNSLKKYTDLILNKKDNLYTFKSLNSKFTKHIEFKIDDKNNLTKLVDEEIEKIAENILKVKKYFNNGDYTETISNYEQKGSFAKIITSSDKKFYDKNGKLIDHITIKKSNVLDGEFEVIQNGIKTCFVERSRTNPSNIRAVRNLVSSNNTCTNHNIVKTKDGHTMRYSIKDKNGNILFEQTRDFKKINDNHNISIVNGIKYDIKFEKNNVIVSKFDKNNNIVETCELGEDILDPSLKDLYKKLPGDYFFNIHKYKLGKVKNDIEACCDGKSLYTYNDAFICSHEYGHFLDYQFENMLRNDKELLKIYQHEVQNFKQNNTLNDANIINYFLNKVNNNGLSEVIAEANALLSGNTGTTNSNFGLRSIVLQQHFPETIALIGKKFERFNSYVA